MESTVLSIRTLFFRVFFFLITLFIASSPIVLAQTSVTNALDFDGSNDRVTIPDHNNLDFTSNYTLEAWVYPTQFIHLAGIIDKYHTSGANGFFLRLEGTSGKLSFDGRISSANVLTLNAWNHIAAVNDNGTRRLYINGTAVSLNSDSYVVQSNGDPLRLGQDYGSDNSRYYKGKMDEVRVWSVVRSASQVSASMNQMMLGTETGLVAYYRFDQHTAAGANSGQTTLTNLSSVSGLNGTLENFGLSGATSNWVSGYSAFVPVVSTTTPSAVTATSASGGGNVTHTGGTSVTVRGVVWGTTADPTVSLTTRSINGTGSGSYSSILSDLSHSTTYYVRAYATNANGTGYGSSVTITTPTLAAPAISYPAATLSLIGGTAMTAHTLSNTGGVPDKVQVYTLAGSGVKSYADGIGRAAKFNEPEGIAVDGSGNVYVSDGYNYRIRKIVPATGVVTSLAGSTIGTVDGVGSLAKLNSPRGLAYDGSGNLYTAEATGHKIRKIVIATGDVSTVAGGTVGFNNGTGSAAKFNAPNGVAVNAAGDIFIADQNNHMIRKITLPNVVSSFAGSISGNLNGNGTSARFQLPSDVAVGSDQYIYVADLINYLVRKISPTGDVTTLAGSIYGYAEGVGTAAKFTGPSGLALDGIGNVYVADMLSHRIRKITPAGVVTTLAGSGSNGTSDGAGTAASFSYPNKLALDNDGNIFVSDKTSSNIRIISSYRIDPALPSGLFFDARTGTISGTPLASQAARVYTIYAQNAAGVATTTLTITIAAPPTVTTSAATNLTATSATLNAIVNPNGGSTTALGIKYSSVQADVDAGNGTAATINPTSATGNTATNISANITGLSHSTTYYYRVYASTAGGTSNGTTLSFTTTAPPPSISYASSSVTLSMNTTMATMSLTGGATVEPMQVSTLAGGTVGYADGTGASAQFRFPYGIAVDGAGNLYVVDQNNQRIRKITPAGVVTTIAGSTQGFADGTGAAAKFSAPYGLTLDATGNIYVSDGSNSRIRKIDPSGGVTTLAGSTYGFTDASSGSAAAFTIPSGLAVDVSGNIFVADMYNYRIRKVTPAGDVSTFAGDGTPGNFSDGTGTAAQFAIPSGLARDASGFLYVSDWATARIRKISPGGVVTTLAGSDYGYIDASGSAAKFNAPVALTVDGNGIIYVADTENFRVRKVTPTGVVTTLAGGTYGNLDGSGTAAKMGRPYGIAVDVHGTLYFTDYSYHLIRRISKFAINPALPAGLIFNVATGEITGTPTALSSAQTYRVTGANAGGTSTTTFTLEVSAPLLTTSATNITQSAATAGGTVDAATYAGATQKGVCWNTTGTPTISHQKTEEGSGTGPFTSTISGLTANTTYYYRSYVTVSGVTSYGSEKSFKTNRSLSMSVTSKTYGHAAFSLTPPVSNSTGAWSFASGTTSVATISGRTVTIAGAGTSIITATQAAAGTYAASNVNFTLTVNKATPAITLNIPNTTTLAAANNMSITATASNGEPVDIAIGTGTATGSLTGSPGSYLLNGVSATGNLVFNATTSATSTHAAGSKSVTMNVQKNNQTITFNTLAPVTYSVGMTSTLTANAGSGEAVTYTVDSGPGSVSGNTLTITGSGNIKIRASQAGNASFNPAPDVEQTLTVNPALPVVSGFTPASATEGDVITITGQYFENVSAVSFGGTAATSYTVVNTTTITAVVGTGHTGVVSVTTTGGTDTEPGFRYKVTWTGATNAFNSTNNWSGGRVPQTDDDIIFSSTAASDLELDGHKIVGNVNFNGSTRSLKLGAYNLTVKGNLTMPGNITGTGRVIMNGTSAQTIMGGGDIPDLEINNSNGVTIDATGDELAVSGTLRSTSGTLTTNGKLRLTSNGSGTARVGNVGGSITGNVIAERYMAKGAVSGGNGRVWRLVSIPVTGAGTLRDFFMNGRSGQDLTDAANRTTETENSGTPIVGHNYATAAEATTAGFDWIGVANSVSSLRYYSGDAGGGNFSSENVPTMSTAYTAADQGYMVFTRGDRKLDFPSTTSSGSTTYRSTGSLKTGTQTVSVAPASSAKFTLVGNPYMSILDLTALYTTNSSVIKPSFWIWEPNMAGANYQGGYVNIYLSGSQWVTNTGSYLNPHLIESGSSFFVEPVSSLSAPANISITELHKSSATAAGSIQDEAMDEADDHGRIYVRLERPDTRGGRSLIDGVMADFHSSFKTALGDQSDREKLRNGISRGAMWLSTDQKILSSEGLPWPTEVKRSIPLYMSGVGDQTLIVRIDPRGMRDRYVQAWLKDNVLKRQIEINMSTPTDYDFIGTGSAAWDSTRFEIVYVEAGRPSTGQTLEPDDAAEQPSVKLYPNPSKSSDVKLSLRAMAPGKYSVHVLDMTGRLVATSTLDHRSVNGEYRILEGRLLSPGKYLIRLSQSGTPVQTLQLIHE